MAKSITERASLDLCQLGKDDFLALQIESEFEKLGSVSGFRSMMQTGKISGYMAKLHLKYLPQVLRHRSFDGLVIDQLSPAACLIAERQALPFVIACNALAMHWDPFVPPPPLPWGFRTDVLGRLRNHFAKAFVPLLYYWLSDQGTTKVNPLLLILEQHHGLAQVAQQPQFFDFPHKSYPSLLHYTGPWHQPNRDDHSIDFPWEWLDGRPLIYASMGTLQNSLKHVFKMMIEAAQDLPMQMVVSKGGSKIAFNSLLPDNVLLVERAPQLRLLEKASLAITHAGLNTVLECLSHGVPMLCIPVTNDQPGVAKRVEWLGAGRVIPLSRITKKLLQAQLFLMLNDAKFRQKAVKYQQDLSQIKGIEAAADIIEEALTQKAPVLPSFRRPTALVR